MVKNRFIIPYIISTLRFSNLFLLSPLEHNGPDRHGVSALCWRSLVLRWPWRSALSLCTVPLRSPSGGVKFFFFGALQRRSCKTTCACKTFWKIKREQSSTNCSTNKQLWQKSSNAAYPAWPFYKEDKNKGFRNKNKEAVLYNHYLFLVCSWLCDIIKQGISDALLKELWQNFWLSPLPLWAS